MSAETPFSWAVGGNAHTQRWDGGTIPHAAARSVWVSGCPCLCLCLASVRNSRTSRIGETLEALVFSPVSNRRELLRDPRLTIWNWALPGVDAQGRCSFRQSRRTLWQARGRAGQVRISMCGGEKRRVDAP